MSKAKYILVFLLGVSVVVFLIAYDKDTKPRTYLVQDLSLDKGDPIGNGVDGVRCYSINRPITTTKCEVVK